MAKNVKTKRGISREQWIFEGLEVLNESGVNQVTIYNLASRLGVSRSGFYWHFKNRLELLEAMLDSWEMEKTRVVTEAPEVRALEPVDRLIRITEMVHDLNSNGYYEIALGQWALQDEAVARRVESVVKARMNYARRTFAELGFEGKALDMRTMLFVGYTAWEVAAFSYIPRTKRRALIRERIELLTRRD